MCYYIVIRKHNHYVRKDTNSYISCVINPGNNWLPTSLYNIIYCKDPGSNNNCFNYLSLLGDLNKWKHALSEYYWSVPYTMNPNNYCLCFLFLYEKISNILDRKITSTPAAHPRLTTNVYWLYPTSKLITRENIAASLACQLKPWKLF